MKVGMFADPHYAKREGKDAGLQRMTVALDAFRRAGCAVAVILGDVLDKCDTREEERVCLEELARLLDAYSFEIVVIPGNHDLVNFTRDELYGVLGEERRPRYRTVNGRALVFIDAGYFADGTSYQKGLWDWHEIYFPYIEQFREELKKSSELPTYVFSHFPMDPAATAYRRILNSDAIMREIDASGCVKGIYQGHDHKSIDSVIGGIRYRTYPDMLHDENAYYIEEI